jgi:hypothetical protein
MTPEDRLAGALTAADEAHKRAVEQAGHAHEALAVKAATALQEAVDRHDATVAEADRVLKSKTDRATSARAVAIEKAHAEFDEVMREQYGEQGAEVVVTRAGSLELRHRRTGWGASCWLPPTRIGSTDCRGGPTFVPSPVIARRLSWSTLQPDEEPAVVA